MTILQRPPTKGNLGPIDVRTRDESGPADPPREWFDSKGNLRFAKATPDLRYASDLTTTEKALLIEIKGHDCHGEGCWVDDPTLMLATGLKSRAAVRRLIRSVVAKSRLEVDYVPKTSFNPTGRIFRQTPEPTWNPGKPTAFAPSTEDIGALKRGRLCPRPRTQAPSKGDFEGACALPILLEEEDTERRQTDSSREGSGEAVGCVVAGRSSSSSLKVFREDGEKAPGGPLASPPAVEVAPESAPDPGLPGDPLASPLDRIMARAEASADDDQAGPPAPPVDPPAERPRPDPRPDHRRRLHEWIKGLGLAAVAFAELVGLVQEMVDFLAGKPAAEGTTFDPHEQIRLALEAAAKKESDDGLKQSIGVYAFGTLKNRLKSTGFVPLADPSAKVGRPDPAALAREREKLAKGESEAARAAVAAARQARWDEHTDAGRATIEARVRAANPTIVRFKSLILAACLAAMDDPPPDDDPPPIAAPDGPPAVEVAPVVAAPVDRRPARAEGLADPTVPPSARAEAIEAARARLLAQHEADRAARNPAPPAGPEKIGDVLEADVGAVRRRWRSWPGLAGLPTPLASRLAGLIRRATGSPVRVRKGCGGHVLAGVALRPMAEDRQSPGSSDSGIGSSSPWSPSGSGSAGPAIPPGRSAGGTPGESSGST